jgi:predicted nucleotidyltransferase
MATTPVAAPADRAQVARVVELVRGVLGDGLVGAWMHGSWVRGGLRARSDLDILAVAARPTTRQERLDLVAGLLDVSVQPASGEGWPGAGRPVELTLVVGEHVRPWRYPPPLELQYGEWWRRELQARAEPWSSPSPDLAIVLVAALAANEALVGPPLAEVIDPIPPADLRQALVDALPALAGDLEGDEANVLLTFARIWATLATGDIVPKDAAAAWALPNLAASAQPALERARDVYVGTAPDRWRDARQDVLACAGALLAGIAGVAD